MSNQTGVPSSSRCIDYRQQQRSNLPLGCLLFVLVVVLFSHLMIHFQEPFAPQSIQNGRLYLYDPSIQGRNTQLQRDVHREQSWSWSFSFSSSPPSPIAEKPTWDSYNIVIVILIVMREVSTRRSIQYHMLLLLLLLQLDRRDEGSRMAKATVVYKFLFRENYTLKKKDEAEGKEKESIN